jgi:hypothetical protein
MHFDYNPEKAAYGEAALAYMHGTQSVDCELGTLPSGQVKMVGSVQRRGTNYSGGWALACSIYSLKIPKILIIHQNLFVILITNEEI